jgi:sec-independent protein translocase protein TatA
VFSQFGPLEIVLVVVVLLIIFGPKRLPSLGRSLGGGMREFKDSITGDKKHDEDDEEQPARTALTQAQATPTATPVVPAPEAQSADAAPEQRS